MHSNREKDQIMSKLHLLRGCKSSRDKSIEKAGGLQMGPMILLMEMVYKLLVEVLTK